MKNNFLYPDLINKNVLLTGASQGIGKRIAAKLLKNKCNLYLIYRNKKPLFKNIDAERKIEYIKSDVRDTNAIAEWLKKYESTGKRIDILINNAGILLEGLLKDVSRTDWEVSFDTNLKSVFFLSQLVFNHMKKFNNGNIINTLSYAATIPSSPAGVYGASKSAMASLTRTMAAEWAPFGIRVNGFSPGVVPTRMTEKAIKRAKKQMLSYISLNRFGTAEEVANVVLFLASDQSSNITGANIDVSGGKLIIQNPHSPWEK